MSKNVLYSNEIASADAWLKEHDNNLFLMNFIYNLQANESLTHSDRWSLTYDYIEENYPEELMGSLVTGLVYWMEK